MSKLNVIDVSLEKPVALFLFAHQDDEFGVFQKIVDELEKGRRVCCAYLTDGAGKGAPSSLRNSESTFVLNRLGVHVDDIFFVGQSLTIPDSYLYEHLDSASDWISEWYMSYKQVDSIYVPAWEGGHHDHDALHAISVFIANEKSVLSFLRQFPLYNADKCIGPFFRVLSPLLVNGDIENERIPIKHRMLFLRLCLCYPSQAITWLGIFPFVVFHHLFRGYQSLQLASLQRLFLRPHVGVLYYEKRNFFTWEKMDLTLRDWERRRS